MDYLEEGQLRQKTCWLDMLMFVDFDLLSCSSGGNLVRDSITVHGIS